VNDVWVAAFDNNGLALTEGFHTLTTTTSLSGRYYNAFIYGHGPDGTNASYGYLANGTNTSYGYLADGSDTSYGYLAGYDRKLNFEL